jgi:hypothetical protein
MAVTIVNGFICLTPGLDEVLKAQKGIDPRPDLARPDAAMKPQAVRATAETKAADPGLMPGPSGLNIVT